MTVYGVTPTGFVTKPVEVIIAELEAEQRANVDSTLNTSASGVLANLNASFAQQLGAVWELANEVYDAHDPNSAEGLAADHNGALSGIPRLGDAKSTVKLRLTLAADGEVDAGSVVSMAGAPSVRFVTLHDAARISAGDVLVDAECEVVGAVQAGAGTLTVIESGSSGWLAVTNDAPATPGHAVELDEDYRVRRAGEVAGEGGSTYEGALADVRKLPGILSASALENTGDTTDSNGLPPHSFEIIVRGDSVADADIAASIWANKPGGVATAGTTAVSLTDSEGNAQTVRFSRAALVRVNVTYHAQTSSTYDSANGVPSAVETASLDRDDPCYFDVGQPVYLARVLAAGLRAQGVVNLTLDIARDPSVPADAVPAAVDAVLTMGARELAYLDHVHSWVSV